MSFFDMQDDIFQAESQIRDLQSAIEEGGIIEVVRDDIVTIDLPDNYVTEINLRPVQHLLNELRKLTK